MKKILRSLLVLATGGAVSLVLAVLTDHYDDSNPAMAAMLFVWAVLVMFGTCVATIASMIKEEQI